MKISFRFDKHILVLSWFSLTRTLGFLFAVYLFATSSILFFSSAVSFYQISRWSKVPLIKTQTLEAIHLSVPYFLFIGIVLLAGAIIVFIATRWFSIKNNNGFLLILGYISYFFSSEAWKWLSLRESVSLDTERIIIYLIVALIIIGLFFSRRNFSVNKKQVALAIFIGIIVWLLIGVAQSYFFSEALKKFGAPS